MKQFLMMASLLAVLSCTAQKQYVINGTIEGNPVSATKVYMANSSGSCPIRDTAEVKNGKFQFKGTIDIPEFFTFRLEGLDGDFRILMENEKYTVRVNENEVDSAKVTGGVTNPLVIELMERKKAEYDKYGGADYLIEEAEKPDCSRERYRMLINQYYSALEENYRLEREFYDEHPTSPYTLVTAFKKIEEMPIEEADARLAFFREDPAFENNRYLVHYEKVFNTLKRLQPGLPAPDYTLNDFEGNPVRLSDEFAKHKLTLIDFWAGGNWAHAAGHVAYPAVNEVYDKYKDKGFSVIGISLDKNKQDWEKGINHFDINWLTLSDLQSWASPVCDELYYIKDLPQYIFVDQAGKIVKRRGNYGDLDEFVKDYLGL